MSEGRAQVILVPGFAGFDILGSLSYYEGVMEILRRSAPQLSVHLFESIPSAGVSTRAEALGVWLAEQSLRGTIRKRDSIHLVGHSTGGLDLRELLFQLAYGSGGVWGEMALEGPELLKQIHSLQFLSTPHRGSNLARWVQGSQPLPQILARLLFLSLHHLGPLFWITLGRALKRAPFLGQSPHFIHAVADMLDEAGVLGSGYQRARSRAVFYDLLRWSSEMASDQRALRDLQPSKERGESPEVELTLYEGRSTRSIVTVAGLKPEAQLLFSSLHALLAFRPSPKLGVPCSLPFLLQPQEQRSLGLEDNDGIVNSVSMVWPDVERSLIVEADHADIIGHYGQKASKSYDLLPSGLGFDQERFEKIWENIAVFIEAAS